MKKRNDQEEFCARLKEARKKSGLSQSEVASKLKVKQSQVSRWELGENRVTADQLWQLAKLYGLSVNHFLSEEGLPKNPRTMEDLMDIIKRLEKENSLYEQLKSKFGEPTLRALAQTSEDFVDLLQKDLRGLGLLPEQAKDSRAGKVS